MNKLFVFYILILAACSSVQRSPAQSESKDLPAMSALKELLGDYSGEWKSYGLDEKGKVKLLCSWKDTISFSSPQTGSDGLIGERAFGVVRNQIFYDPLCGKKDEVVELTEGFKFKDNSGAIGDHYFAYHDKNSGKVYETVEQEFAPNHWKFESPFFDIPSLAGLGVTPNNLLSAKNFTVKTLRLVDRVEIQDVTQTTVINWIGADNSVQSKKFVSRKGQHTRTLTNK